MEKNLYEWECGYTCIHAYYRDLLSWGSNFENKTRNDIKFVKDVDKWLHSLNQSVLLKLLHGQSAGRSNYNSKHALHPW